MPYHQIYRQPRQHELALVVLTSRRTQRPVENAIADDYRNAATTMAEDDISVLVILLFRPSVLLKQLLVSPESRANSRQIHSDTVILEWRITRGQSQRKFIRLSMWRWNRNEI